MSGVFDGPHDRRSLLKLGAVAAGSAPFAALARPASAPLGSADERYLHLVHPDLRAAAAALLRDGAAPPPELAALRKAFSPVAKPLRPDVTVSQRAVPGASGQPDVKIHIINARADMARPAIVHFHGGGFVAGGAAQDLPRLQDLGAALDCIVVSVDYRLAPETRWTGMIDDAYAALRWLFDHAYELGAHPNRIAVMGEGAGGGLATLLAITARDRGEIPLLFQCLVYPMLDDRTVRRRLPATAGRLIWTPQANRFGWQSYLGQAPGTAAVPTAAIPARQADLAGLPPAFIAVAGLDLLYDEGIDYAQRLNAAAVPAELLAIPGAFHGFDLIVPKAIVSQRLTAARLNALRRGLAPASNQPVENEDNQGR